MLQNSCKLKYFTDNQKKRGNYASLSHCSRGCKQKPMDSKSNVRENIELQLSELEMLNSMFPNEGEVEITDPGTISDLHDFLSGKLDCLNLPKLEYVINLNTDEGKVSISISLTDLYPNGPAQVSVHSGQLGRSNHYKINNALREFQDSLEAGSLHIGSIIEWIRDNFSTYVSTTNLTQPSLLSEGTNEKTSRMWIHSHHIYSKNKMKNIEDWAKELNLRGFLMPGKPGFVCVEGLQTNCSIWWQRIRGMNWQKITCKLEEEDEEVRFKQFENIAELRTSDNGMKAFLEYLDEHQSSHIFKEYFGFERK